MSKLHVTTIDKLLHVFETYGGHRQESKLRSVLTELDLTEYVRENGEKVLVMTDQLNEEKEKVAGRR